MEICHECGANLKPDETKGEFEVGKRRLRDYLLYHLEKKSVKIFHCRTRILHEKGFGPSRKLYQFMVQDRESVRKYLSTCVSNQFLSYLFCVCDECFKNSEMKKRSSLKWTASWENYVGHEAKLLEGHQKCPAA